jgi:hypothetical protein
MAMKVASCISETSVSFYETTRFSILGDNHLRTGVTLEDTAFVSLLVKSCARSEAKFCLRIHGMYCVSWNVSLSSTIYSEGCSLVIIQYVVWSVCLAEGVNVTYRVWTKRGNKPQAVINCSENCSSFCMSCVVNFVVSSRLQGNTANVTDIHAVDPFLFGFAVTI